MTIEKYREALYTDISMKKREQKLLWRQKYLKQMGIDVSDPVITKELFRNMIGRKVYKKKKTLGNKSIKKKIKNVKPITKKPYLAERSLF